AAPVSRRRRPGQHKQLQSRRGAELTVRLQNRRREPEPTRPRDTPQSHRAHQQTPVKINTSVNHGDVLAGQPARRPRLCRVRQRRHDPLFVPRD
ncbi:hypothetical protein ACHAXT_010527, partial [Thalassiosira profunda]